jgi:ferredoxin
VLTRAAARRRDAYGLRLSEVLPWAAAIGGFPAASEKGLEIKVHVDTTKCEGYGMCAQDLPEVFKLDEWGYAYVEADGEVPPTKEDLARRAVLDCPMDAITYS